ncbi:hypothetical protein YA50_14010 [Enterobacter kobei]|uniref:hypothetical protein n=1 Tax=Enterobacter kobei TaxID=208224 RepID=UPI00063AC9BE|nr:hypothetical protein [Enterobacter kobei]KLG24003.1 hypothetical protein YA50_14010 [Enterobacter kobei]
MKSLEIKYEDGKYVHLIVDGVMVEGLTAISFNHTVGENLPTLSVTTQITGKMMLSPSPEIAINLSGDPELLKKKIKESVEANSGKIMRDTAVRR